MRKKYNFNYDEITLQNIDDNKHLEFICDGDSKIVSVECIENMYD